MINEIMKKIIKKIMKNKRNDEIRDEKRDEKKDKMRSNDTMKFEIYEIENDKENSGKYKK